MDKNRVTWNLMMESHTERRKFVKTPLLIVVVALLHVVAIGSVFFMQGCGTQHASVEPPPSPVMPPRDMPDDRSSFRMPPPAFEPPMGVETAPMEIPSDSENVYVVKKGDSLSKIASRNGVSAREIAELNNLKNMNSIRIGQKLLLPAYASARSVSAVQVSGGTYVIERGDSLSKIAKRFGVKAKEIAAANNILNPNNIRIGQKLVIPGVDDVSAPVAPAYEPVIEIEEIKPAPVPVTVAPAPVSAPAQEAAFSITVSEGDTLESIARTYVVLKKDLMAANGLSEGQEPALGTELIIPPPAAP